MLDRFKIKIFSGTFFPTVGGAEAVVLNQIKFLLKQDVDLEVVLPFRSKKIVEQTFLKDTKKFKYFYANRLIRYMLHQPNILGRIVACCYRRIFKLDDADLVIYHDGIFAGLVALKCNMANSLIYFHGSDILRKPEDNYGARLNQNYEKSLENSLAKFEGFLGSLNSEFQEQLLMLGASQSSIVDVHNFVDFDSQPKMTKPECNTSFKILTSGRNHPKKNIHYIELILELLRELEVRIEWTVIGRGFTDEIKYVGKHKIIFKQGISPLEDGGASIPPKGYIQLLFSTDIYVHLSMDEGQPLTVIEAIVAKRLVLCFDAPFANSMSQIKKVQIELDVESNCRNFATHISNFVKMPKSNREKLIEQQLSDVNTVYNGSEFSKLIGRLCK